MFKRLIASLVCLTFVFSNLQYSQAQASPATGGDFSINQLPVPGTMVGESVPFAPLALKGLIVNPQKPLEFQFIVDTGRGPQDTASVKEQANQLVKYFLAGLTIPEGDLWVNLSPYEKDRMVPTALGQTDLGRDLLAQDYILKQLTASLIYPEKDLGKEFWSRVYAKAQEQFGTTNIPVNTFNKVWILPDQAQVYENVNAAYVTKSTLKVMLDEDYTALQKHMAPRNGTDSIGSQIVRQIILPEIEKEVNTGKNFAPLRQIYQALILAKWYKETIQNGLLDAVYTNKNKVAGVNLADPAVKEQIYERYLKAYKKGAFNYIKEDPTPDGQVVPRKYFSGGTNFENIVEEQDNNPADVKGPDGAMLSIIFSFEKVIGKIRPPSVESEIQLADRSWQTSVLLIKLLEKAGNGSRDIDFLRSMSFSWMHSKSLGKKTIGLNTLRFLFQQKDYNVPYSRTLFDEVLGIPLENHSLSVNLAALDFLEAMNKIPNLSKNRSDIATQKLINFRERLMKQTNESRQAYLAEGVQADIIRESSGKSPEETLRDFITKVDKLDAARIADFSMLNQTPQKGPPDTAMIVRARIEAWKLTGNVDRLVTMLSHEDASVRKAAMDAIDKIVTAPEKKLPILIDAWGNYYSDVSFWARTEIDRLVTDPEKKLPILENALNNFDPAVREWAFQNLKSLVQNPRTIKAITDYQAAEEVRKQEQIEKAREAALRADVRQRLISRQPAGAKGNLLDFEDQAYQYALNGYDFKVIYEPWESGNSYSSSSLPNTLSPDIKERLEITQGEKLPDQLPDMAMLGQSYLQSISAILALPFSQIKLEPLMGQVELTNVIKQWVSDNPWSSAGITTVSLAVTYYLWRSYTINGIEFSSNWDKLDTYLAKRSQDELVAILKPFRLSHVRAQVAKELGKRKDKEGFALLVKLLHDEDRWVRVDAGEAIINIGGFEHDDIIRKMKERNPHQFKGRKHDLYQFFNQAVQYKKEGYDFKVIWDEDRDKDDFYGEEQAVWIERGEKLPPKDVAMLGDWKKVILGKIGVSNPVFKGQAGDKEDTTRELFRQLNRSKENDDVMPIVQQLIKLGVPRGDIYDKIIELFLYRSSQGRVTLVKALGVIGDKRTIKTLETELHDLKYTQKRGSLSLNDYYYWQSGVDALKLLGADPADLFKIYLDGLSLSDLSLDHLSLSLGEIYIGKSAIKELGEAKDSRAVNVLSPYLLKDAYALEAAKAIVHIGGYADEDILKKLLNAQPALTGRQFVFSLPRAIKHKKEGYGFNIINELPVFKIERGEKLSDEALLAENGGIDLNQINVLRNGKTVNVQFDQAQLTQLEQGGFEGFTPVIINMTRISSPFQLLGINPAKEPETLAKV